MERDGPEEPAAGPPEYMWGVRAFLCLFSGLEIEFWYLKKKEEQSSPMDWATVRFLFWNLITVVAHCLD